MQPFQQRTASSQRVLAQRLTGDRGGRGITPLYELTHEGTLQPAFIGYGLVSSIVQMQD